MPSVSLIHVYLRLEIARRELGCVVSAMAATEDILARQKRVCLDLLSSLHKHEILHSSRSASDGKTYPSKSDRGAL